jgi:ubiquitin-protein ligase
MKKIAYTALYVLRIVFLGILLFLVQFNIVKLHEVYETQWKPRIEMQKIHKFIVNELKEQEKKKPIKTKPDEIVWIG